MKLCSCVWIEADLIWWSCHLMKCKVWIYDKKIMDSMFENSDHLKRIIMFIVYFLFWILFKKLNFFCSVSLISVLSYITELLPQVNEVIHRCISQQWKSSQRKVYLGSFFYFNFNLSFILFVFFVPLSA